MGSATACDVYSRARGLRHGDWLQRQHGVERVPVEPGAADAADGSAVLSTFHRRFKARQRLASTVHASFSSEACMQAQEHRAGFGQSVLGVGLIALLLTLFGCGGGGSGGGGGGESPDPGVGAEPPPGMVIPEELRGRWDTTQTYVPPNFISQFGTVSGNDGSLAAAFFFHPDGRYEHKWDVLQVYFGGNCIRTGAWQENGTLTSEGAEYTFTPGRATYLQTDTCGQFKYLDPAPVEPGTHTLTLDRDATGWPLLRVGYPTGELVLEKCRQC